MNVFLDFLELIFSILFNGVSGLFKVFSSGIQFFFSIFVEIPNFLFTTFDSLPTFYQIGLSGTLGFIFFIIVVKIIALCLLK